MKQPHVPSPWTSTTELRQACLERVSRHRGAAPVVARLLEKAVRLRLTRYPEQLEQMIGREGGDSAFSRRRL